MNSQKNIFTYPPILQFHGHFRTHHGKEFQKFSMGHGLRDHKHHTRSRM